MANTSEPLISYITVKGVTYKLKDDRVDELIDKLNEPEEPVIDDGIIDSSKTWSSSKISDAISDISSLRAIPVDELPTTDIDTQAIYLLPKETAEDGNARDEYIRIGDSWER